MSAFLQWTLFPTDVLSMTAFFTCYVFSSTFGRFVPVDVFYIRPFFYFETFCSSRRFLSTFFLFDLLSQSAFFPFDLLPHSAFFLSTFCRWIFITRRPRTKPPPVHGLHLPRGAGSARHLSVVAGGPGQVADVSTLQHMSLCNWIVWPGQNGPLAPEKLCTSVLHNCLGYEMLQVTFTWCEHEHHTWKVYIYQKPLSYVDGQVPLVSLQTDNICLFLCQQMDKRQISVSTMSKR